MMSFVCHKNICYMHSMIYLPIVCLYILYIHVWLYTCIYVCTHMYACVYIHMSVCMYVCMYVFKYMCMYACMYASMHAHACNARKIMCIYIYMYAWHATCIHNAIHTSTCTHAQATKYNTINIYIYIHIYTSYSVTEKTFCIGGGHSGFIYNNKPPKIQEGSGLQCVFTRSINMTKEVGKRTTRTRAVSKQVPLYQ